MIVRIREKLMQLRRKKLLGRLRLYHFTDARNIPSIKEHGGIYSLVRIPRIVITWSTPS